MKTASIKGDVTTGKITIEEGAYFNGNVEIGGNASRIGADLDTLLNSAKRADER
jgi:cytoskeletal protein CcmA (bactofilin family)